MIDLDEIKEWIRDNGEDAPAPFAIRMNALIAEVERLRAELSAPNPFKPYIESLKLKADKWDAHCAQQQERMQAICEDLSKQ